MQIDSEISKHDIQCHSKGRKQKKKKVAISNGEEPEIDLSLMDPDSPILWLRSDFTHRWQLEVFRVDASMQLIRRVNINQPVSLYAPTFNSGQLVLALPMGVYVEE